MADKGVAATGVAWSAIERFSTIGIQFVLNIVIARILSPSDYGALGMLAIFLSISQCLIDSGFTSALIQTNNRKEEDYGTVFLFNLAISVFVYLVLYVSAPAISRFYALDILTPVLRVVGLNLIISALSNVQKTIFTIRVDFKTQSFVSIPSAIISGGVGIVFAYRGFGVWALVAQTLSNSIVMTALFWLLSRDRFRIVFDMESFRRLGGFGVKLMLSGLLNTAYNNLYALFIGKKYSADSLGYYSRADQFAVFPATTLTDIISRVAYPLLCQKQNDKEDLSRVYTSFIKNACYIIFPLMIGLAVLAKPLVVFLLTDKWLPAATLLFILAMDGLWTPITRINLNLLQAVGRSDLFLRLEIIKKTISVGILLVTIRYGLVWVCLGRLFYGILALLINMYYTVDIINKSYVEQIKDWFPTFLAAVLMGVVVYAVTSFVPSPVLQLVVGVLSGVGLYWLLSGMFRLEARKYIVGQLKQFVLNV